MRFVILASTVIKNRAYLLHTVVWVQTMQLFPCEGCHIVALLLTITQHLKANSNQSKAGATKKSSTAKHVTDGNDKNEGEFEGQGNNQMLVGDPVSGEIHRFLTGPKGCEVTGLCWSSDRKTMFVGIQHPGGSFPDGAGLPRSSIVAVWRDDGAKVG